ncbi:CDC27 protein [Collariella sp. IMI 366227]|nr:CDC27 protein [Collariella sp. IMI 366227]
MLYEFHRSQNAKRSGAVHATYLIFGTKKAVHELSQNGSDGDINMTISAPEHDSFTEAVSTSTMSLVFEERLEEVLAEYENVSCIHVYSLEPHPTKDMALLADVANEVLNLENGKNQIDLVSITNPQPKSAFPKPTQASAPTKIKEEPKPAQAVQETTDKSTSTGPAKKPAASLKRGASSGIMQAFSKAASKPPKVKKEEPKAEEPSIQPLSDDGDDDEEMPQPKPRSTAGYKSKKQREEELKKMMEQEEEEEEEKASEPESPADEPMEEEPPAPEPVKEEEKEIVTASANGRRRGKRRVVHKKQIMDDQGYLVTIQEAGWESFSEDEAPPPTKPKTLKKGGPKGQGSIMSFFSKK